KASSHESIYRPLSSPRLISKDGELGLKPKVLSLTRGELGKIVWTYLTHSDFGEMKSGAWKEVLFARVSENLRIAFSMSVPTLHSMTPNNCSRLGFSYSRLSSSGRKGSFHPSSSYWAKFSMVSHVTFGLNFISLPPAA
nr:hypothetical protein [Tanacetum cinerariifolium]GEX80997.1 hypothetical protein [Tanacetum cinerariifolium]